VIPIPVRVHWTVGGRSVEGQWTVSGWRWMAVDGGGRSVDGGGRSVDGGGRSVDGRWTVGGRSVGSLCGCKWNKYY